jgi:hypothetical protein
MKDGQDGETSQDATRCDALGIGSLFTRLPFLSSSSPDCIFDTPFRGEIHPHDGGRLFAGESIKDSRIDEQARRQVVPEDRFEISRRRLLHNTLIGRQTFTELVYRGVQEVAAA